jgi:hypothetical protein
MKIYSLFDPVGASVWFTLTSKLQLRAKGGFDHKALYPFPVLKFPVVLWCNEYAPFAVLPLPVVLLLRERYPSEVL